MGILHIYTAVVACAMGMLHVPVGRLGRWPVEVVGETSVVYSQV